MKNIGSSFIYTLFGVLALGFLLSAAPAKAETTQCTAITSLPATITTQGIYCFTGNLATNLASGNAIEITVNNVTIDMNGYKLGNLAAGAGTFAVGIRANQKKNITIRNGIIRGFHVGIVLQGSGSSGHFVEDIIADGNTVLGILIENTDGATVRNNRVVDTGGSTLTTQAEGIKLFNSPGSTVTNNSISGTHGTSSGDAIELDVNFSDNSTVKGNLVTDTSTGSGAVFGIWALDNDNSVLENNVVTGTSSSGTRYGINSGGTNTQIIGNRISDVDTGIECSSATSEARDNSFTAETTPISGCTDSGNNT
jgi:parallel beta-helix repeat protein